MPRCQFSSKKRDLLPENEIAEGVFQCPGGPHFPGCLGSEIYVRVTGGVLFDYFEKSMDLAAKNFERKNPKEFPTELWLGYRGRTVSNSARTSFQIYISTERPMYWHLRQLTHEAFHRVCSTTLKGNWVDEMLAETFAMTKLCDIEPGFQSEHDIGTFKARSAGKQISIEELQNWDLQNRHYGADNGFYNKAYLCGEQLVKVCGWQRFAKLVNYNSDIEKWLQTLSPSMQLSVRKILSL
jgi:hypothetical protein